MAEPLFSIIITANNRQKLLDEALESVRAQTIKDFECIVVDDASDPPLGLPFDDPRFRILRRERSSGGPAGPRNAGLEEARGRFVTFLDDDDVYVPKRLEYGLEGVRHAPIGLCWLGDIEGPPDQPRARLYEYGNIHDTALDHPTHVVGTITVRRERALRFDERLFVADDKEWWLRITRDNDVYTVPQVGVLYRWHRAAKVSMNLDARIKDRAILLTEHRDYFDRRPRIKALEWSSIARLALIQDRFVLGGRLFLRAVRADPTFSGLVATCREIKPLRQMFLKLRGSIRKRIRSRVA